MDHANQGVKTSRGKLLAGQEEKNGPLNNTGWLFRRWKKGKSDHFPNVRHGEGGRGEFAVYECCGGTILEEEKKKRV